MNFKLSLIKSSKMKTTNVMLTDLTQREMLEVNGGGKITIILKYGKILLREAAIQLGLDWLEKKLSD